MPITWKAPEFEHRPKGPTWYWLSIIIAVVLVSIAMWQGNFLFAVFIVLAEVMILLSAGETPKVHDFSIDDRMLKIGERNKYHWHEIEAFSIVEMPEGDHWLAVFHFHKAFRPAMHVLIPAEHQEQVRRHLESQVVQIAHEHRFSDALARFLGF